MEFIQQVFSFTDIQKHFVWNRFQCRPASVTSFQTKSPSQHIVSHEGGRNMVVLKRHDGKKLLCIRQWLQNRLEMVWEIKNTTIINTKSPDIARKRSLQFQPCIQQFNIIPVAMPTCYQTTAAAAMIKMANASWLLCNNEESHSHINIPGKKKAPSERAFATHRDVKELLCVVQHTDPDGDVTSGGHGWWSVPWIQCTDAKSLWGSETLPCPKGNRFRVWLCHGEPLHWLPRLQTGQEGKVSKT